MQPYQKIVYNIKIGKSFFFGQDVLYIAISNTSQENAIMYLQEINQYKTNILKSISHELRTPLNGSYGLMQSLLNGDKISKTVKESFIKPAMQCSDFLLVIIDGILDFT